MVPTPGAFDFYLLYRDQLVTHELTEWIEIPLIVTRPWYAFVFNPGRRSAKAFMDVISDFTRQSKDHPESIVGSMPYLTLLHHVSAQPSTELSTHRQFLVLVESAETDEAQPQLMLSSDFHEIGSVPGS